MQGVCVKSTLRPDNEEHKWCHRASNAVSSQAVSCTRRSGNPRRLRTQLRYAPNHSQVCMLLKGVGLSHKCCGAPSPGALRCTPSEHLLFTWQWPCKPQHAHACCSYAAASSQQTVTITTYFPEPKDKKTALLRGHSKYATRRSRQGPSNQLKNQNVMWPHKPEHLIRPK